MWLPPVLGIFQGWKGLTNNETLTTNCTTNMFGTEEISFRCLWNHYFFHFVTDLKTILETSNPLTGCLELPATSDLTFQILIWQQTREFPQKPDSCYTGQQAEFRIYSEFSTCVSNKSRGFWGNPGMSVSSSSVMLVLWGTEAVPCCSEMSKAMPLRVFDSKQAGTSKRMLCLKKWGTTFNPNLTLTCE